MSDKTDTIEKENLVLTFGELEQRNAEAAKEVTESFRIRDEAIDRKKTIDREIAADYEKLAEERKDLLIEQTSMQNEKSEYEAGSKIRREKLKSLAKTEKESLKKLNRLNSYIFKAEEEKEGLGKEISVLKEKSAQAGALDDRVAALKYNVDELEDLKVEKEKEIAKSQKEYSLKLEEFQATLTEMETVYKNVLKATNEAENRKIELDSEYNRKLKDIAIIEKRLNKRWKKQHPNLTLKL